MFPFDDVIMFGLCSSLVDIHSYLKVRVEHSDTEVGGLRCEFAPEPVEEKTVKPNNQVVSDYVRFTRFEYFKFCLGFAL